MIYYLCLLYNIKTVTQLAPFAYSYGLFGPFRSVDQCPQLDPQKDTAKLLICWDSLANSGTWQG